MDIVLPYAGIVLLVGPSNSGKSTLLKQLIEKKQILPSEVVSSDEFRMLVSDIDFLDWKQRPKDEADCLYDQFQAISTEAFSIMDELIEKRCKLNRITFIDATHLYAEDRKRYIAIARKHHVPIVSIVMDIEQHILLERDKRRGNPRGNRRIKQQYQVFRREKRFIKKEGYFATYNISDSVEVEIHKKNINPLELIIENGFDIIGDIHGCYDELIHLLQKLGYEKNSQNLYVHPEGRKLISIGDIMSRGPKSLQTMEFFLQHVNAGLAYMIDSNHGWKIARWLDGRNVTLTHGDELVEEEFREYEEKFGANKLQALKQEVKQLLLNAPSHYVLIKNGVPTLVCTHAGIKDEFIGKQSYEISDYCRYGAHDGLNDEGKPIRKDWTVNHRNNMLIVWGHDPKPKPLIVNNTINIDQGAVFGGELTAFRYPEKEFVSVKANRDYSDGKTNPFIELEKKRLSPPNIGKFLHGYSVLTEHLGEVRIPKEYVIPSIDKVSHVTVPIEELVYIPPTMSPSPTPSSLDNYLEHPREVIDYFRNMGIGRMVAEKKHMGSRGILYLFKDKKAGLHYVGRETLGVIYSRSGRRFFDEVMEEQILERINKALIANNYFSKHNTEFLLLDAEIMPWNLKAKELIRNQYAHVAENAILDRRILYDKLKNTINSNKELQFWLNEVEEQLNNAHVFKKVFQQYCWDINEIDNIQIAPFHVLAHSNETFFEMSHTWHMEMNQKFSEMDPIFVATEYKVISDVKSEEEVIRWWEVMTNEGHEGIVIKPDSFIPRSKGRLVQPAIKVRGRKYLHIIYGMDYLNPTNLKRLKQRNVGKKQKLALREFSLGLEGIQRLVNGESIERVHECVLATLAMESDPVDPRL